MANLLKQLELDELSLVDRPANAQAMVSLFKRDSQEEVEKMNEEVQEVTEEVTEKAAEEVTEEVTEKAEETAEEVEEIDIEALKADVETLKANEATLREENERLRKGLIDNGFVIKAEAIEKKAEVEMVEIEGEMVVKSDIPAPVLKALEAAKAEAEAHAIEKADIELTKRAEAVLPHFDLNAAKSLVKSFGDDEAIMAALLAADKAFEAAMQEFGKSDVDGEFATAADKLDALVKSYMETNQLKKSEYAKAYAAVAKTDEGKALINKSYKGE